MIFRIDIACLASPCLTSRWDTAMNTHAIRSVTLLALACAVCIFSGCATGPKVRANYDKSVDFAQYKTFSFASPLGTDRAGYKTIVSQHLTAAARAELEARGLQFVETAPQLLVNFNAKLSEKMRVDSYPAPATGMGYYGYRGGYYSAWPAYESDTVVSSYTEGTLNVDVVDVARKQMVWEGVAVGSVSDKDADNLQPAIQRVVAKVFEKYPVPAPGQKK
jgi:hypothetical protein